MGSALIGSLQFFFSFFDRDFLGANLSKSVKFTNLFPQPVQIHDFCSDPISVDPICPQPRSAPMLASPAAAAAAGKRRGEPTEDLKIALSVFIVQGSLKLFLVHLRYFEAA